MCVCVFICGCICVLGPRLLCREKEPPKMTDTPPSPPAPPNTPPTHTPHTNQPHTNTQTPLQARSQLGAREGPPPQALPRPRALEILRADLRGGGALQIRLRHPPLRRCVFIEIYYICICINICVIILIKAFVVGRRCYEFAYDTLLFDDAFALSACVYFHVCSRSGPPIGRVPPLLSSVGLRIYVEPTHPN